MKYILSFIGFESTKDFASTLITYKYNLLLIYSGLLGAFFRDHLWNSAEQIIFLLILLFLDLFTGILCAFKSKTFSSRRLPRWCGIVISYAIILFAGFNLAKYNFVFSWLPSSLYAVFCATVFVSLIENLHKLNWLNSKIYDWLKSKINIDKLTKKDDKA